jgi:hypothetical protein
MPTELWEKVYAVNVRGTFLTVKWFLKQVEDVQDKSVGRSEEGKEKELDNVAIILTGSECGVFGQAGHAEYASGKAALQYGLVKSVKNEIVRLNSKARINAVAPGWVDTKLIEGKLDDGFVRWRESEGTVPLRKIAKPEDVARAAAFLASHRAAGHISGQCLSVDGGMEGRIVWTEEEARKASKMALESSDAPANKTPVVPSVGQQSLSSTIPQTISTQSKPFPKIKVLISVDFDAVSGWLGTGTHPDNNLADYSSGFFSAYVGVPRLLKLFKKLGIQEKVTWFVPMHSAESFPDEFKGIVESGCEVGLHGYCHEVRFPFPLIVDQDGYTGRNLGLTSYPGRSPTNPLPRTRSPNPLHHPLPVTHRPKTRRIPRTPLPTPRVHHRAARRA